jgi:2-oxoisovalerate dehydrogenase E1 component
MHFCAGQEAVPLGAIAGLGEHDQIIATYRGHGWALASGLEPRAVMAELCHRAEGINGGRGGSAYMMAPQTRFIGENSIVGAGTTIACGVAIANQNLERDRVVVVSIGDGAMNQGSVHEAFAFAAAKALPVIFVVENNSWSELTATSDMFKISRLAQRGAGYGIQSATVDGTDPIVVRDSIAAAAAHARRGAGPVLLEFTVPRLWGHYNRDIEHYRKKEDREAAAAIDPLKVFADRIIDTGLMNRGEIDQLIAEQTKKIDSLTEEVLTLPYLPADVALDHVISSRQKLSSPVTTQVKEMTYIEAVNAALRDELASDPKIVVFGEDVGKSGGIFGAARYLQRDFGAHRVFDTPIAENAILGAAVGAAMSGLKPIVEIMWADFLFVALDQLVNQASNVRYITGGSASVPLVVRTQQGATPGSCAQHSQSIEAILGHVPGLKVALAATATDAYALLRAAAADPDPCIVIEARGLYQTKAEVHFTAQPEPVGKARLRRSGSDCVIITWGTMVARAIEAAENLTTAGHDVAVLDLRWISPLDETALVDTVRKASGNVVILHEAVRTGGFAGEIALRLSELLPDMSLNIRRVTTPDVRMPAAPPLQEALLPNVAKIEAAAKEVMARKRTQKRRSE